MRLLTDEDMRWVAGGNPDSNGYEGQMYTDSDGTWIFEGGSWQLYDIPVTGPSHPTAPPPYFPPSGGGGGGGGGGVIISPPPPPPCDTNTYPTNWDRAYDQLIDAHGANLASEIARKTDAARREYSAYVWEDAGGNLHESGIVPGNATDTGQHALIEYGIPNGSKIVAFIHNHPTEQQTSPGTWEYAPQGQYLDNGDLSGLNWLATQSGAAVIRNGVNYMRNYLVFGGEVSEYDYEINKHIIYSPPQFGIIPQLDAIRSGSCR